MKSILFVFVFFLATGNANAQSKSKNDQNFRICFVNNTYVACDENAPVSSDMNNYADYTPPPPPPPPPVFVGRGANRASRMTLAYDDPNAAYKGEESMINDGVEQNKERNINYLDQNVTLPPNTGNNSRK